jgi:hypothetical protein
VCPWVQVIVSAMTSPTPGYLPVPSYGDDVAGGGSPARLITHRQLDAITCQRGAGVADGQRRHDAAPR